MNKKQLQENKGFALLLSLIISSIALSIGLSMLHITLKQLTLGTTTRGSEIAFQVANAGMECLRHARNEDPVDFITDGGEVTVNCLGQSGTMTDSDGDTEIQEFNYQFDWVNADGTQCLEFEAYAMDASSAEVTLNFAVEREMLDKVCALGDVCAIAFVRGFNRSCADAGSSIFTVQRELSIEF